MRLLNEFANAIISLWRSPVDASILKDAIDFAAIGMGMVDLQGKWVKANRELCRIVGYQEAELLALCFRDITYPEDVEYDIEHFQKLRGGEIDMYKVDERYIHKSGRIVWVHLTVSAIRDRRGIISRFFTQVEDITEVRNSIEELKTRKSQLESVFENVEGSMSLIDENQKYVIFNRNFINNHRLLAHREPASGEEIYSGFPDDIRKKRLFAVEEVLKGKKEVIDVNYIINGHRIYYRTSFNPVIIDGRIMGVSTYSVDLTEMKATEERLLKINRLYQFTSSINEMMVKTSNALDILQEACRIAVEIGGFRFAWVGMDQGQIDAVIPIATFGHDTGYLQRAGHALTNIFGNGPVAVSMRMRASICCNDIEVDRQADGYRSLALERHFRSSITLPLVVDSRVLGVFELYMTEPSFFDEIEVVLLQRLTENICFALDKARIQDQQRKAQVELFESEQKFRSLVEQIQVGVFILKEDQFVYVNSIFEKISGLARNEIVGKVKFERLIHEDDSLLVPLFDKLPEQGGGIDRSRFSGRIFTQHGKIAYVEGTLATIVDGNSPAIIGTISDITDRLEEERRINKVVIAAQERERMQLGMELHDNVQQMLTAARMSLHCINSATSEVEAVNRVNLTKNQINQCILELRRLSHQLAPSFETDETFRDRIKSLLASMKADRKISICLEFEESEPAMTVELEIALYRILQEQFNNILKYAKATSVEVAISSNDEDLSLSIKDNGIGFDVKALRSGIGLENIKRRASEFNGKVQIHSDVGKGCEIAVHIPIHK